MVEGKCPRASPGWCCRVVGQRSELEPADCAQAGRMEHSASLNTAALSSRQWHPAPVYTVGSAPKSRTVEELPRAPANSQSNLALDP